MIFAFFFADEGGGRPEKALPGGADAARAERERPSAASSATTKKRPAQRASR